MNARLVLVLALSTLASSAWAQGPKVTATPPVGPGVPPTVPTPTPTPPGSSPLVKAIKLPPSLMSSEVTRFSFGSSNTCVTLSGTVGADAAVGVKVYGPGRRSPYYEALVRDNYSFSFKRPANSLPYPQDFTVVIFELRRAKRDSRKPSNRAVPPRVRHAAVREHRHRWTRERSDSAVGDARRCVRRSR
jgi:hypothetical protein